MVLFQFYIPPLPAARPFRQLSRSIFFQSYRMKSSLSGAQQMILFPGCLNTADKKQGAGRNPESCLCRVDHRRFCFIFQLFCFESVAGLAVQFSAAGRIQAFISCSVVISAAAFSRTEGNAAQGEASQKRMSFQTTSACRSLSSM